MRLKVLAISNNFPTNRFPEKGAFVMNILLEMARQGAAVDVIAPVSWVSNLKRLTNKPKNLDFTPLNVCQPNFTSIPQKIPILKRRISFYNDRQFTKAIERKLKGIDYDFIYAHFFPSALSALKVLGKYKIPVFLNLGESDPWDYDELYGKDYWIKKLHDFQGIVTVSKRNYNYLLQRESSLASKVVYIPNGVNTKLFKPLDKTICRKELNLPLNETIVVFCGHFEERKGPLRVLQAINTLNIKGVFLGSNGSQIPTGDNVLYAGPVSNSELPKWLNSADAFVLPSLSEGMSNAVLEALACCIPLVVSDEPFNTDFLTKDVAEFVDPLDYNSISKGILNVLETSKKRKIYENALIFREEYSLSNRIKKIFEFVKVQKTSVLNDSF